MTPAGSKIKIDYEADDYAILQNQKPGRMFTIKKVTDQPPTSIPSSFSDENELYTNHNGSIRSHSDYIIIDLGKSVPVANAHQYSNLYYNDDIHDNEYFKNILLGAPQESDSAEQIWTQKNGDEKHIKYNKENNGGREWTVKYKKKK